MGRLFGDLTAGDVHDPLRDRAVVELSLPSSTRQLVVDGVRGFVYPVTSEGGDLFQLFVWWDGATYQVTVLAPDVAGQDPHACHLLPQARICLASEPGSGMPTLQGAYAKSVLWANGYSVYLRTGAFPF